MSQLAQSPGGNDAAAAPASTSDPAANTGAASAIAADAAATATSSRSGRALDAGVQKKMEAAFGADFSNVRVHTDSPATKDLNANAFAQGSDIHFDQGKYDPNSEDGRTDMKNAMRRMAGTTHSTLLAVALLACSARGAASGPPEDKGSAPMTTPTTTAKPTTTLEQVKQAYPGARVAKIEHNVPGVELFNVMTDREMPADQTYMPTVVAIKGDLGSPILTGSDAMRAVIGATKDPMLLAQVAMAIEQQDAELLTAPKYDDQKKQNVGPPKLDGNVVTYWTWTRGVGRELWPMKLDLTTGKSEQVVRRITEDERITQAIDRLASNNLALEGSAVQELTRFCATDVKARTALLDAAAKHPREATRAAAVDASPACGTTAVDTLINVLDKDVSMTVRWKAAKALGEIGDAKAKPALEKAAQSSDSTVKSAATRALAKIK